MDDIHGLVDGLVIRFGPVIDEDLPLQLPAVLMGRHGFQLFDQLFRLSGGDEFGGLDRVHQEL